MTLPRALTLCAACLVVGLAVGRFTAVPAEETHQETAREEIASKATESTETTIEARQEATQAEERVVWRERIVYREGPVAEETRELEASASTAQLVTEAKQVEVRVETVEVEVVREVEVFRELRQPLPDWRLGIAGGLHIPAAAPVYGGTLERRLWGPLYVGATVLSDGTVLGQISVGLW